MRHAAQVLIVVALLSPLACAAGGSPRIWGQSRTHQVTFADDATFSEARIEIRKPSSEASDSYDKIVLSVPFRDICVATDNEIRCSPEGKTILAGVVYRLTMDGSPRCFGATSEPRYTCIKGCRKELPRYLWIDPYEC